MKEIIYQAINITAGYGNKIVLKDLSLDLERAGCTLIVGANGCGKTTLFSVLAGMKKIRSGELLLNGEKAEVRQLQKQIGYVPQENPLFPELTVKDNLMLWYGGREAFRKAESGILERLGLRELFRKRVGRLSGGMQRRVCIACAMAGDPGILIMDEPGVSLDLECKEVLHACLREYREKGGTILMSSHDKADWELGDKIYLMKDGKLYQKEPQKSDGAE